MSRHDPPDLRPRPAPSELRLARDMAVGVKPGEAQRVFVRGLSIEARVGVYKHEMINPQPLILDVELELDARVRPSHDEMAEALDYDWIAAEARRLGAAAHLKLIETFAEQLAQACFCDARVRGVRIRIEKPRAIPSAAAAGVEIVRVR